MHNGKNGARPIPEGCHTLTPHIIVRGAAAAIEFYQKAFGAQVVMVMPGPDGKSVAHAELKIGDSMLFMCEEFAPRGCLSPVGLGGTPVTLTLYVEDADAVFNRAASAGAQVRLPVQDMFWGDRYGQLTDPFGHIWAVATHKEDLTPEEIGRRAQAAFAKGECAGEPATV
jgi:PhnB protein